ncbi:oligosaccharide flippase family protein, partial [Enterococcus cecorum]|uniref:lipopolysaccharide biosynthesis protein n=1 Tax=Enterococcus cecorum TaxID=44008 RepID=UPI001FABE339
MKSNEKRLLNDTIIFAIGNLGSKIIQFLLVPLYTYSMTTEEFGVSDLLLTTVSILMPIFSFSVADGLLRFGLDDDEKKENVLKNSVLIAFVGSVVSLACIPVFLQISFIGKWAILLVIILNLRVYQDIFTTYLKVCNRNKLYAASSMIFTFTLCMCNVFFLTNLHLGIVGY